MPTIPLIQRPLELTRDLAVTKSVRLFTDKFGFVYFGRLPRSTHGFEMVHGLTKSLNQVDKHYALGHYKGYDITIVERHTVLPANGKPSISYTWLTMQFDLAKSGYPHIFLTSYRHGSLFYRELFTRFAHLQKADHLFTGHEPMFSKFFKVFASPTEFPAVNRLITRDVTAMLGYHFRQFDYEVAGDHLYIYAINNVPTPSQLREMLRIGMWLVERFDKTTF